MDEDDANSIAALVFYYLIYEGGWFMGGFNPIFAIHHARKLMASTVTQLQYIRRDETTHIQLGLWIIQNLKSLYQDEWKEVTEKLIPEMVKEAYDLEHDYIIYACPRPILGYSSALHMQHFAHLMNMRLGALRIGRRYRGVGALPWLSAYELRSEQNFFERHVTEYRNSQDLWKSEE